MKGYNVVWLLVDAVRNYRDELDPHLGKLKIMDRFGKEGIEFKHCVTSAPSTTMSISSMMTGIPAYYLSRQYYGFKYDNTYFTSLPRVLKSEGYEVYGIFRHPITRENLKFLFPMVEERYYPAGVTKERWWSNRDLNRIAQRLLPDVKAPFFMFFHFNCRDDPKVSETVEECIEIFRSHGYDDKNTIFILCSDHGYPDWRKHPDVKREEVEVKGHDLVLTDDNVLIPLSIKFPGHDRMKKKEIEEVVTSLDIMPTILDLIDAKMPKTDYRLYGKSLVPLIEGNLLDFKERCVRVDSRFIFQPERKTAIRSTSHKYVIYKTTEKESEELYDLKTDPDEGKNIISSKKALRYREEYIRQEKEAISFHKAYIKAKILQSVMPKEGERIILIGKKSDGFVPMLREVLKSIGADVSDDVDALAYDKAILTLDSRYGEGYSELVDNLKKSKAHMRFMIDSDCDIVSPPGKYSALKHDLNMAWRSRYGYIRQPRTIVRHIKQFVNKRIR